MVLILFSIILQWKYFNFFFYSCKLKQHLCCCLQLLKKSCCNTSANSGHSKEASLPWFSTSVSSFILFSTWDFINPHQPPPVELLHLSIFTTYTLNKQFYWLCLISLFPSPFLSFNFWLRQDSFNEFIQVLPGKTCPALYFLCTTHSDSLNK